jgi:hypothetical protein
MNKAELTKCAEAKSDQIDADNLIGGITMDVTIKAVQRGPSNEQPLQLVLEETDKFYRPSKTFRRALIGCFSDEPANWIGQRLRLIRNPDTMFGGVKVGGVEVSHASISAPMVFMLQAKRGKKSAVSIDVIPPIQKPVPMPAKVKAKAEEIQKPHARGTISGDPSEGDMTGIAGECVKPSQEILDKVVAAFATIGIGKDLLEVECGGKPMEDWVENDLPKARAKLNELILESAQAKAKAAEMAANPDTGEI